MLIRSVELRDVDAITDIYNGYVTGGSATFETEPVGTAEMRSRIAGISARFPYLVCEEGRRVAGDCYAPAWKTKAAYRYTLETTVYLSPDYLGRGIGKRLMRELIEACRRNGYRALIACITAGNEASIALHTGLGFNQVSHFEQVGRKFGRWLDVVDYELLLNPGDGEF